MRQVNIHEAKTHLSRLLETAQSGKEILIAKAGKPIAKLVPVRSKPVPRKKGLLKGRIRLTKDFDKPLPDEVLKAFEGER